MKILLASLCLFSSVSAFSQSHKTENLIVVTLDGMRWQEVFGGIDSQIVVNKKFTWDSAAVAERFSAANRNQRKEKLFPFLWNIMGVQGQLYG
ncbi:MAG TPA: hypothetical protein VII28_07865, partial [Puia sp.]